MNIIDDWANSEFWAALGPDEKRVEIAKYLQRVRELGLPVVVEGRNGPEIEWSYPDQEREVDSRGQCQLCRRSFTDPPSMKNWVRIVDPRYHEGFLDQGGVAAKCPHVVRKWEGKPSRGKDKEKIFD